MPKLRFKGFTDDWEQRKLGDIVSFSKGSGYSKSDLQEDGTPIILYGRLYTKYETVISDVDTFASEKSNSVFSNGGEVIVPASGETAEDISVASVVDQPGIILGGDLNIITPPQELDSAFLAISISNGKPHSDMAKMAQGKSVVHLHNSDLAKINLPYPSYEEQRQISHQFKSLDNLIALHQRKCDELKKVKKYMLQKMFPKKGEKVPEIRFAGFTGDWEQRKLFDCLDNIIDFRGRTPKKLGMEWSEDGYLALSALNVKDGFIDFAQDVHYGNQDLYDKWMTGKELHKGQVLFTTEAPMGNVAQVPDERKYILSQRTIAFEVKDDIITENFLAVILRSPNVVDDLNALASGGTAKGVSQKSLEKVSFFMPSNIEEQTKIADTFSNLDDLIALHQRKCDTLKEIKKYMLQNMFPKK